MGPRLVRTQSRIASDRTAVLIPLPVAGAYDYRIPEGMELAPGRFVRIPLGVREVTGVVWGEAAGDVDETKLRDVAAVLEIPPLPADLLRTVAWTASYTMTPPGAVLRMAMSVPEALDPPRVETAYVIAPAAAWDRVRLTDARKRVLDFLADGRARKAAQIARATGTGASVVRGLVGHGLVSVVSIEPAMDVPQPDWRRQGPDLTPSQQEAATRLRARIAAGTDRQGDAARRDHRLGQDRGLFRSGSRRPCARPSSAGAAAGDRAYRRLAAALRDPVRRAAAPLAFRRHGRAPQGNLARGLHRQGPCRGRGPFGALPALFRSWPDRRRRGARRQLQAGRRGDLQRPRHCDRAGAPRRTVRSCWPPRRPRWRPWSMSSAAATKGSFSPNGSAAPRYQRSPRSTCVGNRWPPRPGCRPACAGPCRGRWTPASRRFSSSTGAATRRSPSAGPAVTGSNAPTAARGWWTTG